MGQFFKKIMCQILQKKKMYIDAVGVTESVLPFSGIHQTHKENTL